jgi:hypothetical protein
MKRLVLFRLAFALVLLYASYGSANAQTYATVEEVPTTKWNFSVVDTNFNPATLPLLPNTSYFLSLSLSAGVTVTNLSSYIVQDGDGWYRNADFRPQTFFTGVDAPYNPSTNPTRQAYLRFTTVEDNDFSGAFFKIRLSSTGSTVGGASGSLPKSKIF